MEDALNPRMAGSTEGMTLQVLAQIRDSLTALNRDMRHVNEGLTDIRERVIRLEERDRRLEAVEHCTTDLAARVNALEKDKDRRDGAIGLLGAIPKWVPIIGMIASVLAAAWLYGRSAGIVPAPPTASTRVEAPGEHGERHEGAVGGKP